MFDFSQIISSCNLFLLRVSRGRRSDRPFECTSSDPSRNFMFSITRFTYVVTDILHRSNPCYWDVDSRYHRSSAHVATCFEINVLTWQRNKLNVICKYFQSYIVKTRIKNTYAGQCLHETRSIDVNLDVISTYTCHLKKNIKHRWFRQHELTQKCRSVVFKWLGQDGEKLDIASVMDIIFEWDLTDRRRR